MIQGKKYWKDHVTFIFQWEKSLFWRKYMGKRSLLLHHRKKQTYSRLSCWFITCRIRIENLDCANARSSQWRCFAKKMCSLKCRKIHRKLLCQRKHPWIFKNTFFTERLQTTAPGMQTLQKRSKRYRLYLL